MLGTRLALKRLRLPAVFLAGLALGALLTLMASAALSSSQRGTLVEFGSADWFGPERGPVCNWHHHFCIVTLEDGELVALYTYDTHPEFRRRGCTVHWGDDYRFTDPRTGEMTAGWFRGNCSGSTFTHEGVRVFGPSERHMDRFAVTIEGDSVIVDTRRLLCGDGGNDCERAPRAN